MINYQQYYYNACIRKSVIAFGAVFNNILIKRKDQNGIIVETLKVPINYSSSKKYISRLQNRPEVNEVPVAITLPRMAFQMRNIYYDTDRKLQPTQQFRSLATQGGQQTSFVPVPYNIDMELSILAKNQDDGLQIIEQILPQFHPALTVTIQMVAENQEEKDIPIVLNSIGLIDEYEGDYTDRSYLEWTLNFTIKTYIFGPVTTGKDIRKVIVDYNSNILSPLSTEIHYEAEVESTSVPPIDRDDIDPLNDPYRIVETISEKSEDDDYFAVN